MNQTIQRQHGKRKRKRAITFTSWVVPVLLFSACGPVPRAAANDPRGIVISPVRTTPIIAPPTSLPPAAAPTAQLLIVPTVAPTTAPTTVPTMMPTPTSVPRLAATSVPASTLHVEVAPPTELTLARRKEVFTQVWQLIKDNYLYQDFNGTDWSGIREEYAPRIEAATSNDEFYTDLIEMVARLNDHHSRFGPPAAVVTEDAAVNGQEATVGIGVQTVMMDDGAFVQAVFPDGPAARVLHFRDRIVAVDGRPYHQDDGDLEGPEGSTVRLTVVSPGAKPHDVVLTRQAVQAHITPYYRRFPGEIGYVAVSTLWVNDTDEQVSGALTELVAAGPLNGVILDLRGNPGGWSHVMSGILSHFVRGQVGSFFDRRGRTRPLVISAPAGPDLRGKPLAVLIDRDTASYAEVIAAVLQHEAKAQIVGEPSAGNTETIYAHTLEDGSRLWLAQEGFKLQSGANLEGNGVQPDETVNVNWRRYSEEDDPQLLEALRMLGAGPK